MLVAADFVRREYIIGVSELTGMSELLADLSYLVEAPSGCLVFDFTHTAPNLTQAVASEHIPGQFGFHPLDRIAEQLSFIGRLVEMPLLAPCSHKVSVVLPAASSHLGRFFVQLGVLDLISRWDGLSVETKEVWEPESMRDDNSRRVLVPLTDILVDAAGDPASAQIETVQNIITDQMFDVFRGVDAPSHLSTSITGIAEGIVGFVRGGLLTALYFPMTGYLELSITNRTEGTIGDDPDEQLDALIDRLDPAPSCITEMLNQVARCYGTVQLCNGLASIFISPDGSFTTMVERTGLYNALTLGPRATVVFQIPPQSPIRWESFARERVSTMWSGILN
jgi:hypothetical protein